MPNRYYNELMAPIGNTNLSKHGPLDILEVGSSAKEE
jgi:hypothetical protein